MVDTNPIINIIFKRMITISFRVIELIMKKTFEGTVYSHLYNKRVQEYSQVFLLYFQLNQPMTTR